MVRNLYEGSTYTIEEVLDCFTKKVLNSSKDKEIKEYINLEDVLNIVSQYCPDDDGSCSKAGTDLREMLDEIEALPTIQIGG